MTTIKGSVLWTINMNWSSALDLRHAAANRYSACVGHWHLNKHMCSPRGWLQSLLSIESSPGNTQRVVQDCKNSMLGSSPRWDLSWNHKMSSMGRKKKGWGGGDTMGMRRGRWKPPQNMWLQGNAENIYKKNAWQAACGRLKENSASQAEIAQQP